MTLPLCRPDCHPHDRETTHWLLLASHAWTDAARGCDCKFVTRVLYTYARTACSWQGTCCTWKDATRHSEKSCSNNKSMSHGYRMRWEDFVVSCQTYHVAVAS